MARDFEPSASQQRAISLFGLTFDGTHAGAKAVLTAAGLTENGIPNGLTPAKAKKLSDDELRAAFGVQVVNATAASVAGANALATERAERERNAYRGPRTAGDYIRLHKAQERERNALKAAGYRWSKEPVYGEGVDRYDSEESVWVLTAPDGRETTVSKALAAINYQR